MLPKATIRNVVAEVGDPDAERTFVLLGHHDAARTSFIFDERLPHAYVEHFPALVERSTAGRR